MSAVSSVWILSHLKYRATAFDEPAEIAAQVEASLGGE
jgi:hypothetical protein